MAPDASDRRNTASHTSAHYFLEALSETGIEYLFCNFGTDHAPIIEEIARWTKAGRTLPKVVVSPPATSMMCVPTRIAVTPATQIAAAMPALSFGRLIPRLAMSDFPLRIPRNVPTRPSFQVPTTKSVPSVRVRTTDSQPGPMTVNSVSTPWTPYQNRSGW